MESFDEGIKIDNNLLLRKLKNSDFNEFWDYVNDPDIKKQFFFDHSEETARIRLQEIVLKSDNQPNLNVFGIALSRNDELIGIISLDKVSFSNKNCSLAYGLRKKYRHNGYMYLAVSVLIDYIFDNLDIHRIELACNIDNIASKKTILKLGALFEGTSRESKFYDGKFKDGLIFSILKDEWKRKI